MTSDESKIQSYADFVQRVSLYTSGGEGSVMLFRGQQVVDRPLPGVARSDCMTVGVELKHGKEVVTSVMSPSEEAVLNQLKSQGALLLGNGLEHQLDYLVLAQHYGLKTRLLDWCRDASAALWFACRGQTGDDRPPADVYVYILAADGYIDFNPYRQDFDPFAFEDTFVFQPRWNNPRVLAQKGWFSIHPFDLSLMKFKGLPSPQGRVVLFRLTIDGASRKRIMSDLESFGVNESTLFPDLSGLCSYLNRTHYS